MKKLIFTVLMGLSALSLFAKDQFVGFYEGEIKGPGAEKSPIFSKNNKIFAEVYRDKDIYRLKLQSSVLSPDIQIYSVSENLSAKGDGIDLKDSGDFKLNGKITSKKITAKGKGDDGGSSGECERDRCKCAHGIRACLRKDFLRSDAIDRRRRDLLRYYRL